MKLQLKDISNFTNFDIARKQMLKMLFYLNDFLNFINLYLPHTDKLSLSFQFLIEGKCVIL